MKQVLDGEKLKEKVMQQYGTNEEGWENSEFKKLFDSCTLPGNLLASFGAEVGSVFGHYTEDPKGDQVELKIVAIPDGLEGEQIEKGKKYHILILEEK